MASVLTVMYLYDVHVEKVLSQHSRISIHIASNIITINGCNTHEKVYYRFLYVPIQSSWKQTLDDEPYLHDVCKSLLLTFSLIYSFSNTLSPKVVAWHGSVHRQNTEAILLVYC